MSRSITDFITYFFQNNLCLGVSTSRLESPYHELARRGFHTVPYLVQS